MTKQQRRQIERAMRYLANAVVVVTDLANTIEGEWTNMSTARQEKNAHLTYECDYLDAAIEPLTEALRSITNALDRKATGAPSAP